MPTLRGRYTGDVVRSRSLALFLAVLVAATPILGLVCAIDCEEPAAAASSCHVAESSTAVQKMAGTLHRCDQDHTTGAPAVVFGSSARECLGAFVPLVFATIAPAPGRDPLAIRAMHGPPGPGGRDTSFLNTVLRI